MQHKKNKTSTFSKVRPVSKEDIADFAPCEHGFVFSTKKLLQSGSTEISFYSYDIETQITTPVTKKVYSDLKFGEHGNDIANLLGNGGEFLSNDYAKFHGSAGDMILTLDRKGLCTIFSPTIKIMQKWQLIYKSSPACSPVAYNKILWCAVPDENILIKYSIRERKVLLQIGSKNRGTFDHPVGLTLIDGKLFISDRNSGKIRVLTIEDDYAIADYHRFEEPVYKFYRIDNKEFVLLESGIYEVLS